MNYNVVSLDLCGTIADCRVYDDMWYRVIPELYSRSRGTSFEESVKKLRKSYSAVGPSSLNWYRPSYWVNELSLDMTEFKKAASNIYVKVDMGTPRKDETFWKMVIEGEHVRPYRILHLGDDYVYDYLIPSMAGIRARVTSLNKVVYDLRRELFIRP